MKRHYESAEASATEGGFGVLLDGRPIRTPAKRFMTLPNRRLAEAVAEEWNRQGETLKPETMHLTAFATTAIDRVADNAGPTIDMIVEYARTDLLCYRADAPADLARRQDEGWQPLLDWAALTFDAPLTATCGVMPVAQPEGSIDALRRSIAQWDAMRLVPAATTVGLMGSAVLALAIAHRRLTADEALRLAHVDEDYQAELWGVDSEAEAQWQAVQTEVRSAETFLRLLDA